MEKLMWLLFFNVLGWGGLFNKANEFGSLDDNGTIVVAGDVLRISPATQGTYTVKICEDIGCQQLVEQLANCSLTNCYYNLDEEGVSHGSYWVVCQSAQSSFSGKIKYY